MQASLEEAVEQLSKWANEDSFVAGSLGTPGVGVVFCGLITRLDDDRFVVRAAAKPSPVTVNIFPRQAVGFEYHDDREVPEEIRQIARDVVAGLGITFPSSYLLIYEMKEAILENEPS